MFLIFIDEEESTKISQYIGWRNQSLH